SEAARCLTACGSSCPQLSFRTHPRSGECGRQPQSSVGSNEGRTVPTRNRSSPGKDFRSRLPAGQGRAGSHHEARAESHAASARVKSLTSERWSVAKGRLPFTEECADSAAQWVLLSQGVGRKRKPSLARAGWSLRFCPRGLRRLPSQLPVPFRYPARGNAGSVRGKTCRKSWSAPGRRCRCRDRLRL